MRKDELRPCIVKFPAITETHRFSTGKTKTEVIRPEEEKRALFHRWIEESTVVEASLLIGGAPAGRISYTSGIVEYENGVVQCVKPEYIRFTDVPKCENASIPVYNTITDIVNQLESCGYTCEGGPLEMNLAFIALKKIARTLRGGTRT